MRLRRKTGLIVGLTLVGLVGTLYAAAEVILTRGLMVLEDRMMARDLDRAAEALGSEVAGLGRQAADWAFWDDTYAFVASPTEAYVRSNLNEETLANVRLEFVVLTDRRGAVVFERGMDLAAGREAPLRADVREALLGLVSTADLPENGWAGVLALKGGAVLVAARPILTSDRQGPSRGVLVVGRALGSAAMARLGAMTRLAVSVHRRDDAAAPAEVREAAGVLAAGVPVHISCLSRSRMAGHVLVPDVRGGPALVLRVEAGRPVFAQVQAAMRYFVAALVVTGLVIGAATLLLLEKAVLARLAGLGEAVRDIGRSRDASGRLPVAGRDEVADLASAVNAALASLEQSRRDLEASERTLATLMENLPGMVYRCRNDASWTMQFVSEGCRDLVGYAPRDFLDNRCRAFGGLIHPDDRQGVWEAVQAALDERRPFQMMYRIRTADGGEKWVWEQGRGVFAATGDLLLLEGFICDITERRRAEQALEEANRKLQALAATDETTGLCNRRRLLERLDQEFERLRRYRTPLAVAMVDVDHFKAINDTYGHSYGDHVLAAVAGRLGQSVRAADLAGRYGGEEFLVLLPDTGLEAALAAAERLRTRMAAAPLCEDRRAVDVTISIGVAGAPEGGAGTVEALLDQADQALYAAKQAGRNCTRTWTDLAAEPGVGLAARLPEVESLRRRIATLSFQAKDTFVQSIRSLVHALEARDPYTRSHSENVTLYAVGIAETLGLDAEETAVIRRAAQVHDLGKIGIPDAVLHKPGALMPQEREVMKTHVLAGVRILDQMRLLEREVPLVRHHHERWDGRGYPDGLRGEAIPLGARVLAVADSFDALTSDRVYRRAAGTSDALRILLEESGRQFDARVVDALIRWLVRSQRAAPPEAALAGAAASPDAAAGP